MNPKYTHPLFKISLLSLAVATSVVQAQDAAVEDEIVVTGYKGALLNSTNAKRESVGFSDEVFSDDIGKMPSQNLAESLSRIPGVRINRDVTGEGQQISVRGLGADFTKVVLNGNSMSIASMGNMNANLNGRQVDLDTLPTELFKSLSVSKTTTASQIEGGVSGYVNMRTSRASDFDEGSNFRFSLDGKYKDTTGDLDPKAMLSYSYNGDNFGFLATVVNQSNHQGVDGFEVITDTKQNTCLIALTGNGCRAGGGNLRYTDIASADFVAANPNLGYSVGDTIDVNAVAGLDPSTALFPYISRLATTNGKKDSTSALLAFEYSPVDGLDLALDILNSKSTNSYIRDEWMYFYRRNYIHTPVLSNLTLDANNRIETGTFYNSQSWVGSRDYDEDLSLTSFMPSASWQITDAFKMDASYSKTSSEFNRDDPYALVFTAPGTMTYNNNGVVPEVNHSALDNFAAYSNFPYAEDRFRYEKMERQTDTRGIHVDFALGEDADRNGIKFGIASDKMKTKRLQFNLDTTDLVDQDANNALNMNDLWTPQMNTDIAGLIGWVDYGDRIDGWNGLSRFAKLDWNKLKSVINYSSYGSTVSGFTDIEEDITAIYVEANTESEVVGHTLRTNTGVRVVDTDQHVEDQTGTTDVDYKRTLPSFSAVMDATDSIKVRASASRSLSRANPSDMFPGAKFNTSGIDQVTAGNPKLAPFESTNFDIGGEWYFSDLGYVGITYYTKDITGFTYSDKLLVKFRDLDQYGIDLTNLSATQLAAESVCTPNCDSTVTTRLNTRDASTLNGFEVIWVQPLDFIVEGLGFNASANSINDQSPKGAEITGISDSYNFTAYYENESFQSRITYYHQDGSKNFVTSGMDVTSEDRSQVDLSLSYKLPVMTDYDLSLTFDAYNLTNEPVQSIINHESNQTFEAYYPGTTYTFGVSGKF